VPICRCGALGPAAGRLRLCDSRLALCRGWLAPTAPGAVATASDPAAAARTPAAANRRMMSTFMVTSFTPFAGYDVDGGGEVVVVARHPRTFRAGWQKHR